MLCLECHSSAESRAQACGLPWFALKVRTRSELLVDHALCAKRFQAFVPTYIECRKYSDRIKKVEAPLFDGYVFCRLDPDEPMPVLKTNGVEYIVGNGKKPCPIDDGEMAALAQLTSSHSRATPWPYLRTGHRVEVRYGSLCGMKGVLLQEKGVARLVISVDILQRSVAVEIDRTWVRPA